MAEIWSFIIAHLLRRTRQGDPDAARELAGYVAYYLDPACTSPMPAPLRAYVAGAFRDIAGGASPEKALGAKRGRGRPRERARGMDVAAAVHDHPAGRHKEPGGAYFEVAAQFYMSPEAVESIYRQWRDGFQEHDRINREEHRE